MSAPDLTPVWYQNLCGFIKGIFPADERWKAIFLEHLEALRERLAEVEREKDAYEKRWQLHAGDTISLNNEVETFRSHWLDAEARAEAAEARVKQIRAALENTVSAWEALPGGQQQSVRAVERWLANDMKPAIDRLRALASETAGGGGE